MWFHDAGLAWGGREVGEWIPGNGIDAWVFSLLFPSRNLGQPSARDSLPELAGTPTLLPGPAAGTSTPHSPHQIIHIIFELLSANLLHSAPTPTDH